MTSPTPLCGDQRGMILVPALSMVAVLAVALWHIADLGSAVLVKLHAQGFSDAAALEGAIWHAQGMNLLVTLNIIMACILAVFVAIRLVVLGLLLVTAVLLLLSFIPGVAGAAAVFGRALDTMHRVEDRVAKPVMNALKLTSNAEKVVAAAMPWVAAALPVNRLNGNASALAFSVSMLPDILEQKFKDMPIIPGKANPAKNPQWRGVGGLSPRTQFPARMGTFVVGSSNKPPASGPGRHAQAGSLISRAVNAAASGGRRAGNAGAGVSNSKAVRVIDAVSGSLPAQEEDFFMVCSRSAELVASFVTKVLLGPLNLDDAAVSTFNSNFGKVIGSVQSITCTPLSELNNKVMDEIESQVSATCAKQKDQQENPPPREDGTQPEGKKWTAGQQRKCEKDQKDKAKKVTGPGNGPDKDKYIDHTKGRASDEEVKTAAIWGEIFVPQGSPLLHVWSVAHMEWAAKFAPGDAEAEFRHPCNQPHDKDGRSCGDNAMWRYGWHAQIVQLKPFETELAHGFGDLLQGWVNRALGKAIQGVVSRLAAFVPAPRPAARPIGIGGNGGGGKHRATPPSVQDVLLRHVAGVRSPEVGNSYWSRKLLGPELGNRLVPLKGKSFDDLNPFH